MTHYSCEIVQCHLTKATTTFLCPRTRGRVRVESAPVLLRVLSSPWSNRILDMLGMLRQESVQVQEPSKQVLLALREFPHHAPSTV